MRWPSGPALASRLCACRRNKIASVAHTSSVCSPCVSAPSSPVSVHWTLPGASGPSRGSPARGRLQGPPPRRVAHPRHPWQGPTAAAAAAGDAALAPVLRACCMGRSRTRRGSPRAPSRGEKCRVLPGPCPFGTCLRAPRRGAFGRPKGRPFGRVCAPRRAPCGPRAFLVSAPFGRPSLGASPLAPALSALAGAAFPAGSGRLRLPPPAGGQPPASKAETCYPKVQKACHLRRFGRLIVAPCKGRLRRRQGRLRGTKSAPCGRVQVPLNP